MSHLLSPFNALPQDCAGHTVSATVTIILVHVCNVQPKMYSVALFLKG